MHVSTRFSGRRGARRHTILAAILAALVATAVPAFGQKQPPPGQTKQADKTPPEVSVAFSSAQLESRLLRENASAGVSCDERCSITATLAAGARTFAAGQVIGEGSANLNEAGKTLVRIPLTAEGRDRIRAKGNVLLVLRVQVTDQAGNRAAIGDRLSRTQRLSQRRSG